MLAEGQVFGLLEHRCQYMGEKGEELSYQPLIASFAEQHGERFRPCSLLSVVGDLAGEAMAGVHPGSHRRWQLAGEGGPNSPPS